MICLLPQPFKPVVSFIGRFCICHDTFSSKGDDSGRIQRQRKIRRATAKLSSPQTAKEAQLGQLLRPGPPPSSMMERRASFSAVSGRTRMKGCIASGKVRRREKHAREQPHRQHHEVQQARDGLHRLRAARHEQADAAERKRAGDAAGDQQRERPSNRNAEHERAEAEKRRRLRGGGTRAGRGSARAGNRAVASATRRGA